MTPVAVCKDRDPYQCPQHGAERGGALPLQTWFNPAGALGHPPLCVRAVGGPP